ncbi:endonuclease/exonuclease/phosphatase family protein [Streptomyces sp. NBC_00483]|uniref:endonuclease/exonuclease/phosphatase family protein n=1 Tax=Streptomyces sp. NBC_00483 TaxID=2975756 RepID=UPI002E187ADE
MSERGDGTAASTDGAGDRRPRWRRGRVLAAFAVVTALVLLFHRQVPNTPGRLGSLVESFLPWSWVVLVVLFGLGLLRRAPLAMLAVLPATAVWAHQCGVLLPEPRSDGHDLVVVQHNVSDENTDPQGMAHELSGPSPDLIALEELLPKARAVYERGLAASHPHHAVVGTVGLWSRYPLTGVRAADIKPAGITEPWNRGLRAVVEAPQRDIAVYVAHLPSVRLGVSGLKSAWRDESARRLGAEVAAEKTDTVLVVGDFNGTVDDRGLAPLTSQLDVPDRGFTFSYPAAFPVARIDQIMARSANVGPIRTLPATGSDHLPVLARIALDDPVSAAPSASRDRSTR